MVNLNGHTRALVQTRGLNNKTRLSEIVSSKISESQKVCRHVGTEIGSEVGGKQLKYTSSFINNVLYLQPLLDQSADMTSTVSDISTLHQPPVGFLLFVTDAATM